jgi:hypothetical protein
MSEKRHFVNLKETLKKEWEAFPLPVNPPAPERPAVSADARFIAAEIKQNATANAKRIGKHLWIICEVLPFTIAILFVLVSAISRS